MDILDQAIMDPAQEVAIKVKPLQQATTGPGSSSPTAQSLPNTPLGGKKPGGPSAALPGMPQLKKNPQLAMTPSTVEQDDIYAAQLAQAHATTMQRYLADLRDIGFTDEHGNFLPGLLQTEAARRRSQLQHDQGLAVEGVNNDAVRGGAFFSGRRATNLANAEDPYTRQLGSLESTLANTLTDRYNDIGNTLSNYSLTQDTLLAELAARQAAAAKAHPSGEIYPGKKKKLMPGGNPNPTYGNMFLGV